MARRNFNEGGLATAGHRTIDAGPNLECLDTTPSSPSVASLAPKS